MYAHIPKEKRFSKLNSRGRKGKLIGYEAPGIYRCKIDGSQEIVVSRDVVFYESSRVSEVGGISTISKNDWFTDSEKPSEITKLRSQAPLNPADLNNHSLTPDSQYSDQNPEINNVEQPPRHKKTNLWLTLPTRRST